MAEVNPITQEYAVNSALQQEQLDERMQEQAPYLLQQQQATQAALVEQTNPSKVLRDIELRLRGKEEFEGKIVDVATPMLNDLGVGRIRTVLSTVINQNTILSHLEDKEIGKIIIQLGDNLIDVLQLNWREYEIKDRIILDHIVDCCLIATYMSLKRAWKQNEKNWLNKAVVENINTSPRFMPQKKGNVWSKFKL